MKFWFRKVVRICRTKVLESWVITNVTNPNPGIRIFRSKTNWLSIQRSRALQYALIEESEGFGEGVEISTRLNKS